MTSTAALSCPKMLKRRPVPPTANAASAGKEKENTTPTILQKEGSLDPSAIVLEKEEKKDDNGIMIMKSRGAAREQVMVGNNVAASTSDASKSSKSSKSSKTSKSSKSARLSSSPGKDADDAAAPSAEAGAKAAPWNPLDEVDSALLSALCDARERKALFRLEQVIIDFTKDKSAWSMEVGGAFNSIVLNQNGGGGKSSKNNGEAPDGQITASGASSASQQGLQDLQYQQQRGMRQTSFQRLILHRLADRFDIIREQVNNANHVGNERGLVDAGGGCHAGQSPSFSPGLIRLVKTNESRTPSHLLIDIDLSLLINYKNPRARNYGGGNSNGAGAGVVASAGGHEDGAKGLAESMALATLEAPSATTSSAGGKKSSKKMVIMKRSTSTGGSNSEGKGKGKQKGKSRKKRLEDREKAYEEARARIFGNGQSPGDVNTGDGGGVDDRVERGERPPIPQSVDSQDALTALLGSCHSSFSMENDGTSPTSPVPAGDVGEHIIPSQLITAAPSTDHSSPPSPGPQGPDQPASSSRPAITEAEAPRQPSSFAPVFVPAAVTSGAIFKAVYRNRQQEENDPDFKRRSDVRPSYVPYVANPYGASVGYVNPAMGQQQPPPAAAMMAMHVQQQQTHPPHFYPGLQPGPQFPTPQDAAAAAFASNVGNNPPPQWAAAPPRGYYPPPPQQPQQGQQEKHPQAWQPRPNNSSQMQPKNGTSSNSGNNYAAAQFHPAASNTMSNSQPKQPNVILWGPGAQQGDADPHETTVPRTAEAASGGKDGAAVYKAEDFPAL